MDDETPQGPWENRLHQTSTEDNNHPPQLDLAIQDLARPQWDDVFSSPVHSAVNLNRPKNLILLIESGADVNSIALLGNKGDSCTALHWAAFWRVGECVRTLLDLGADKGLEGRFMDLTGTPLEWARKREGDEDVVKILEGHKGAQNTRAAANLLVSKIGRKQQMESTLKKSIDLKRRVETEEKKMKSLDEKRKKIIESLKRVDTERTESMERMKALKE